MRHVGTVVVLMTILLIPTYASAQSSRIILLDTFGDYNRGEQLFVFGQVTQVTPDLFVVIQIINPDGDLCQIQQLRPLSNGDFITESTPLVGRICGLAGEYEVKVFYGEFLETRTFNVSNERQTEAPQSELVSDATSLVENKIAAVGDVVGPSQVSDYEQRLSQATSSEDQISEMSALYSELLLLFFDESDFFDLDPKFRPSIEAALDSTQTLVDENTLSQIEANKIDTQTYSAAFYAQIGMHRSAISALNDVYIQIANVDPQKVSSERPLSYEEINDLLLNIMTKSDSIMSRQLKEEIGFIFARGTGPIYSQELDTLVDMLTKGRILDAVLKSEDKLTTLIRAEWGILRESLLVKETLSEFIEQKERVDKLHEATMLLRNLDRVDRFTSSDPKPELATLIEPQLNDLLSRLQSATSPDDIIEVEQEILDMKNVIEISSRISSTAEFSKRNNVDAELIESFELLLDEVENASTLSEILDVISEYDATINELREQRNPLSVLKFEYEKLKSKAELQADYESLVTINNALQVIDTAIEIEKGNPTINRIEKIEVLLSWASQQKPAVQEKLNSYTKDAYAIRASDILQRAKSLENLIDLGEQRNRFLPGYTDYTESMREQLNEARDLVISNDLDAADTQVRQLFSEWREVSEKYAENPDTKVSYNPDEIKRIEYREKVERLSNFATEFYNADFEPHAAEFTKLKEDTYELIEIANFVDVDRKLVEMRTFLADSLELQNNKIIYDITYDQEKQIWVMSGAVDKEIMDRRGNLYLTVYDMNGKTHSTLEFSDTKQGDFFTQWHAPTEPGLYVVMLQWRNNQASQIVNVQDKSVPTYTQSDLKNVDYAREFEELKSFIEAFGGANYETNKNSFDSVVREIETALSNKDFSTSSSKIIELNGLIERYLPDRSKTLIVEAHMQDGKLYLSGAIYKTVAFSEQIYIDIFDQQGNRVDEIPLRDTAAGYFNEVISKPYKPGTYVVQLHYHNEMSSDFFRVN